MMQNRDERNSLKVEFFKEKKRLDQEGLDKEINAEADDDAVQMHNQYHEMGHTSRSVTNKKIRSPVKLTQNPKHAKINF